MTKTLKERFMRMNEVGAKLKEPIHNSASIAWANWIKDALQYYKDACSALGAENRKLKTRINELEAQKNG